MKQWPPYAYPATDGKHQNASPALNRRGSWPDARGYQQLIDELCALVVGAGLTLNEGASNQVLQAVLALIGANTTSIPDKALVHYGVDSGAVNAVLVNASPTIPVLTAGVTVLFLPLYDNTGDTTLDAGPAVAPVPLRQANGTPLQPGDIRAGRLTLATHDGTNFRLLGANGALPTIHVTDSGTANAIIGTGSPTMSAWRTGQVFVITKGPTTSTSATPTADIDGKGAKTIVKRNGGVLVDGDLPANTSFPAYYDGTSLRLLAAAPSDLASGLAAAKSLFNVQRFTTTTRVSMSAASAGTFVQAVSGISYAKKSPTSLVFLWMAYQAFSPSPGVGSITQRGILGGVAADVGANNGFASGTIVTLTSSPILTFAGLGAGTHAFTLSHKRDDSSSWTTVFNPTSSDAGGYPATNTAYFIFAEVEP